LVELGVFGPPFLNYLITTIVGIIIMNPQEYKLTIKQYDNDVTDIQFIDNKGRVVEIKGRSDLLLEWLKAMAKGYRG